MLESIRRWAARNLDDRQVALLSELTAYARRDILRMTTEAGSGHPGGSLSSVGIYLLILAALDAENGDQLVVSHGHTAAGIYAALGRMGFVEPEKVVAGFRRKGSPYEGHPSLQVPGISWCSGALGQGLSVGCGFAAAARQQGKDSRIYVVMGDGEQSKGQLSEAREFAVSHGLNRLTAVIDYNRQQASGSLENILPQQIAAKYRAAGWTVEQANGHDFSALYQALKRAEGNSCPSVVIAETVMGCGVPGRENDYTFHGAPLSREKLESCTLGLKGTGPRMPKKETAALSGFRGLDGGKRKVYPADAKTDLRSAFGTALLDVARSSQGKGLAVFDCDLMESVKVSDISKEFPASFYESGIAEENAVTTAAAMAKAGMVTFAAGFSAFMIDEVYSQLRMGDINHAPLKIAATHCGLDVGEDGKTHQCLDYLSLLSNLRHMQVLMPADPNQTDAMVRYMVQSGEAQCLCMGRSKTAVLTNEEGTPFFGKDYQFRYGEGHWLRRGTDAAIITFGMMAPKALEAWEELRRRGIGVSVYLISCPGIYSPEDIKATANTGLVVTYEDHFVESGIGKDIGAFLAQNGLFCKLACLGVKEYGCSAKPEELYQMQGLSPADLANVIIRGISS